MEATIIILFMYGILISAKYLQKCGELGDCLNDEFELRCRVSDLTGRMHAVSQELHAEKLANVAQAQIIADIKGLVGLEKSGSQCAIKGRMDNQVCHSPEETASGFT